MEADLFLLDSLQMEADLFHLDSLQMEADLFLLDSLQMEADLSRIDSSQMEIVLSRVDSLQTVVFRFLLGYGQTTTRVLRLDLRHMRFGRTPDHCLQTAIGLSLFRCSWRVGAAYFDIWFPTTVDLLATLHV